MEEAFAQVCLVARAADVAICDVSSLYAKYPDWTATEGWHMDASSANVMPYVAHAVCKPAAEEWGRAKEVLL